MNHSPDPHRAQPRYSVVVPVYGNERSISAVVDRLNRLNARLGGEVEGVFVVDGSPDRSGEVLRECLPKGTFSWQLIWHSRNFGSFAAIRTGLQASRGELRAVMAADLQEPESLIEEFLVTLDSGSVDVVVGTREGRDDPAPSRWMSSVFWGSYRRFVEPQVPKGGVDVFACTRPVSDVLCTFSEAHSSLVGLLFWVGFRRGEVPYRREPRADAGRSGWSMRRKIAYMMDSVYSFTDRPIWLMKAFGFLGVAASLMVGAVTLAGRLSGLIQVQGYTALVLLVLFLTSLLLMCLGIVGSYVWRTYENSKGRPGSIVMWHQLSDSEHVGQIRAGGSRDPGRSSGRPAEA